MAGRGLELALLLHFSTICKINSSQNKQAKRGNKGPGNLFKYPRVRFYGLLAGGQRSHAWLGRWGAYKGLGGEEWANYFRGVLRGIIG